MWTYLRKYCSKFCGILLGLATLLSLWLAYNDVYHALIGSMSICILTFIVSTFISISEHTKELSDLNKKIAELNSSNTALKNNINDLNSKISEKEKVIEALGKQNQMQRDKIHYYQFFWNELNFVFTNAIQGSKKERFEEAYKLYLIKTSALFNEHKEDM